MTSTETSTPQDRHVLKGQLFRRRSSRVHLTEQPPPPKPAPVRRPAKVARMLALAHHLQGAIDRGLVPDRAAVARKLGLTRARVTQLLDLLLLAPDLQLQVLELEAMDGVEPMAERTLRAVAHAGTWAEQRAAWGSSLPADAPTRPSHRRARALRVHDAPARRTHGPGSVLRDRSPASPGA